MTGVTHPPRPQPTKETQVSEPPSTSLPPRREQGPTPSFNPTQTPLTTANDRSGPYQTRLRSHPTWPWTYSVRGLRKYQHDSNRDYTGTHHPPRGRNHESHGTHFLCRRGLSNFTAPGNAAGIQALASYIIEIDNKRLGKEVEHDMLREEPYGRFCRAAMKGLIRALVGGPSCRTWSILRWFPRPGTQPARVRRPDQTWGLPGLCKQDQECF